MKEIMHFFKQAVCKKKNLNGIFTPEPIMHGARASGEGKVRSHSSLG